MSASEQSSSITVDWPTNKDRFGSNQERKSIETITYSLDNRIGAGAFAEVYSGTCTTNGKRVAIKVLNLDKVNSNLEDIQKEVAIMKSNDHCNIVSCYASFVVSRNLYLTMQLMNKGSCLYAMKKLKKITNEAGFKEDWIAVILKCSLEGLVYFHKRGKIHRDLKAGNILLNQGGEVKIADFGVSGAIDSVERVEKRTTFVGTPCWMAPEVMEQIDGYNAKADIWSLGITALELAKGHAPYAKDPPMQVLLKTLQDEPPSLTTYEDGPDRFSNGFKDFVKSCLQKDSSKRPDATKLLSSSFIKKAKGNEFLAKDMLEQVPNIWNDPKQAAEIPRVPQSTEEFARGTTWTFVDPKTSTAKSAVDGINYSDVNFGDVVGK